MLLRLVAVLVVLVCAQAVPFPLQDTVDMATANIVAAQTPTPTGLTKDDYLQSVAGITGYERTFLQSSTGIIVDPYANREVQYATPTFAHAAIVQGLATHDDATLNAGIHALNISLQNLINNACADGHCNFFTLPIMLAIEALQPVITPALWNYYMQQAAKIKTSLYTNLSINWGLVAAGGEYLRYLHGLTDTAWVESMIAGQLFQFSSNGMFMDPTPVTNPSTAYDIFPRIYLEYMIFRGYNGSYLANLTEILERGALSSLLLQSPIGEWPTGGRSSQHQWNEAVECAVYEMRANIYKQKGDMVMASAFKRAARLAHRAFMKYISSSGYVYVVKNRMPPVLRFGYEDYSYLTNYNGLPASFLALAHQIADDTIPEGPSFAETGGFVFEIPTHHKVIANVKGNYFEWETCADPEYDATGLTRMHYPNALTLIGPSAGSPGFSVGIGWEKYNKTEWLSQFGTGSMSTAYLNVTSVAPDALAFSITYPLTGSSANVTQVVDRVTVLADSIQIATSLNGDVENVQFMYPIFQTDGLYSATFNVSANQVVMYGDIPAALPVIGSISQTYSVVSPAMVSLTYNNVSQTTRNGYFGSATASVPATQTEYVINITRCAGCLGTQEFTVGSSSTYTTIGAALDAVKALSGISNYVINIQPGTYSETLTVSTPNGVMRATGDDVIITSSSTAALTVSATNVKLYGLTVYSSGQGSALVLNPAAQASVSFYECTFLGFQDTIVSQNSFVDAYFRKCYVEGAVDVVAGSGTLFFDGCTLASNGAGSVSAQQGISAANDDQFVFYDASLYATAPSPLIASLAGSQSYTNATLSSDVGLNYLGRPADSFSRVAYLFSDIASNVNAQGWTAQGLAFDEFQNRGASGAFGLTRVGSKLISGKAARNLALEGVFGGIPAWIDPLQLPTCGAIYSQCGGEGFTGSQCCRASLTCVANSTTFSQCLYVGLSEAGSGVARVYTSGTIGLSTIYVNNPFGGVTTALNTSDAYAHFDAVFSNVVAESVIPVISSQMSPIPAINVTVTYSPLSDPRNITVDLLVTIPSPKIKVVNVTPAPSSSTSPPSSSTTSSPASSSSSPSSSTTDDSGWYVSPAASVLPQVFALVGFLLAALL